MHLREDLIGKDDKIKSLNDEIQFMQSRILVIEGETRELRAREETNQVSLLQWSIRSMEIKDTKYFSGKADRLSSTSPRVWAYKD